MTKTEITAFDLHFLLQELQPLANERLDKIYVLEDRGILITFGAKIMLQAEPGKCWTPLQRPATPEQIHPFAAQLRKLIGNSRISKIEQVCSERIIAIHVTRSEKQFILYLEVFGRGNVVLCDGEGIVITVLALNDRVQRGKAYQLPKSIDTFHLDSREFAEKFAESKENISKTLAVQFGLGKVLAEELCVRCGIPAAEPVKKEHADDIFRILHELLVKKISPQIIYEGSIVSDATPIPFDCYSAKKRENVESFGSALDRIFALPAEAVKEQKLAPTSTQLQKVETMIAVQQQNLAQLEQKSVEERKKGEYIYEHYQEIKKLLDEIVEAKKKLSWKEVKAKFSQIKEINEATADIVVEI
jgi:predicted ribosome quality control (RQC) complex YloA/Tae2 family protein